ncbi:hypothetical protein [Zhihengliuella halotolerans]|uniref:hypothetical protein n=1 Tax=Zhihengliuella halotolerans TaxID=370736 RepID=UPI000C80AAF0|nr:hypothetical protein [Zhihengliuella halotolerans]
MLIASRDAVIGPHERALWSSTESGKELRPDGDYILGHLMYGKGAAGLPSPIDRIALDPFDPQFGPAAAGP